MSLGLPDDFCPEVWVRVRAWAMVRVWVRVMVGVKVKFRFTRRFLPIG